MFDWIRVSGDIVELKEANARPMLRVWQLEKALDEYLSEPMLWSIVLPDKDLKLYYERTKKLISVLWEV